MVKGKKFSSLPEKSKKVEAPNIVHRNLMDLTHTVIEKARRQYNRVDLVSSPLITTKEYLENYASIFGHE